MEVQALDFAGDYKKFEKAYVRYRQTKKTKYMEYIYSNIKHNFVKFQELIISRNYKSDITIYTLMCLLEKDSKTPVSLKRLLFIFESWMASMDLTWFDIFTEAFLLHMNKFFRISKWYKSPRHLAYFISLDMKMFVFAKIRNIFFLNRRDITFSEQKKNEYYLNQDKEFNPIYFDNLSFIKELEQDKKMFNIFMKQIFNKTLTKQERELLCHSISQKLLDNLEITQMSPTSNHL